MVSELVRKQLYIYRTQDALLKRRARELGVTEAELVRQAIDGQMNTVSFRGRDATAWEEEKEFIRQWMAKGPVDGRRTWRREDLYED
ncbi:hypothetical protein SY88_08230 [Clostridiales bacterium PH28_bin88]|nr:hypothetical protein SY88_08230 [Clostridiales bacterium PH28_bin88]